MKVVLDTNVIVAAFASRGICAEVFELCLTDFEIIISEPILAELKKVFSRKLKLTTAHTADILQFLLRQAKSVKPVELPKDSCRDPGDVPILATALAARADVIISGDEDLLVLKEFQNIRILSPKEFWQMMNRKGKGK